MKKQNRIKEIQDYFGVDNFNKEGIDNYCQSRELNINYKWSMTMLFVCTILIGTIITIKSEQKHPNKNETPAIIVNHYPSTSILEQEITADLKESLISNIKMLPIDRNGKIEVKSLLEVVSKLEVINTPKQK